MCTLCFEPFPEGSRHVIAGTDIVCKACFKSDLKPRFLLAVKHEHHYPVQWGPTDLNPREFPFEIKFLARWEVRIQFYSLPKSERMPIMCSQLCAELPTGDLQCIDKAKYENRKKKGEPTAQCQRYLGTARNAEPLQRKCKKCHGVSCGVCGLALQWAPPGDDRKVLDHNCDTANLTKTEQVPLVRGVDFQLCPNPACKEAYSLESGCNVMTCVHCRTHFCFLCGVAAHHDGDHWTTTCPRWNRPGTQQAHFDAVAAPRVIDQGIRDGIDELKGLIAWETDPRVNALLIDHAISLVLSGDAVARLQEAEREDEDEDGWAGADVDFVEPLLALLKSVRVLCVSWLYDTDACLVGSVEERSAQVVDFSEARLLLLRQHTDLEAEEPNVYVLYPSLRPMVLRIADRAQELQEVASARLGQDQHSFMLHRENGSTLLPIDGKP